MSNHEREPTTPDQYALTAVGIRPRMLAYAGRNGWMTIISIDNGGTVKASDSAWAQMMDARAFTAIDTNDLATLGAMQEVLEERLGEQVQIVHYPIETADWWLVKRIPSTAVAGEGETRGEALTNALLATKNEGGA